MGNKFPTPMLKCTNAAIIDDTAVVLSFRQQVGATSKLPQEFTIAISKEDIKNIINNCTGNSINPLAFDKLPEGE